MSSVEATGYLKTGMVSVKATDIKASTNLKNKVKKAIPSVNKTYEQQLFEEVNQEREIRDENPFDGPKLPKEQEVKESMTDMESGAFHKDKHRQCQL